MDTACLVHATPFSGLSMITLQRENYEKKKRCWKTEWWKVILVLKIKNLSHSHGCVSGNIIDSKVLKLVISRIDMRIVYIQKDPGDY